MKTYRKAILVVGAITVFLLTSGEISALASHYATCLGKDPCKACSNCKYCKHCAKDGGTCGICKRS